MLKQQFQTLKKDAINLLCQTSIEHQDVILQVYNITIGKNDKVACYLSDGNYCIKAFFKDKNALTAQKNQNALIRIIQHVVADSGMKIGIINFELICQYNKIIGFPKPFNPGAMHNPQELQEYSIQLNSITKKYIQMIVERPLKKQPLSNTKPNNYIKQEEIKKQIKKQMRVPAPQPLKGSVKDYQTIKGLFIGLKGWHLLCRITKLDYQEFTKKNSDKLVKLLNIELMDRSQVKISGAFFYEAAQKFKDQLKLNSVYKISEGQISNQNYNNSKNDKLSPFRLIFSVNSHFQEVSDVQIIAKSQDSAITLNQLLLNPIYDQEFDIIGILTEIEEPKQINKDNKTLTKWQWVIADPIQQKKIFAILWNDKIKPDQSLIGRTIILSRFILKNYNGSLTLNSKARSTIEPVIQHMYQSMQQKVMNSYQNYDHLSDRKIKLQDPNNQGIIYDNLKSLNEAISFMGAGQSLKSDLNVWVNRINTKKWFYDGCPQCNKLAEKGTSCNCGKYVQETVPHFIMSTQLSDSFGSIWATAYDEQAKKIFWQQQGVINKLIKYDANQLKDVMEDYLFQGFKLRLYTKKDEQGRVKHLMGRLQSKAPQKVAQQNVDKIKAMMNQMML